MTAAVQQVFDQNRPLDQNELKKAFHMFSEMSQQLTDSYAFLEDKVEQLSGELATVSAQRMQELAEKERIADRLESLLEMLPAGVLQLDENGVVVQSNQAADELLLPAAGARKLAGQRWRQLIQRCFKPRHDDGHEISLVDGRRVSLRTAAMTNERGQLVLLTDMTETRALQAQLSQHERLSAMGKMVASLAHQIRTPLAAATLYAGHLGADSIDETHRMRFAAKLQDRLHHLERQVRDMLIFARGEAPLNDHVSVGDLVTGLKDAMEVPLNNAHAQCEFDISDDSVEFLCNFDALVSAVMNLVNNALEASADELAIRIRIEREGERHVALRIMDNGPGLPDEQKARIMEPFYTTKSNGTGLGLAVVQAVIRAHQGRFSVTDSPSGGLQADILLPCPIFSEN